MFVIILKSKALWFLSTVPEAGAVPDVEIEHGVKTVADEFTGEERSEPDYSAYGDIDDICRQVSAWFSQH